MDMNFVIQTVSTHVVIILTFEEIIFSLHTTCLNVWEPEGCMVLGFHANANANLHLPSRPANWPCKVITRKNSRNSSFHWTVLTMSQRRILTWGS